MGEPDPTGPAIRDLRPAAYGATDGAVAPEEARMRGRLAAQLFGREPLRQTIGRFEILDKIGEGGLGVVYAAHDPNLDRRVAIKVIRANSGVGTADVTVLQREAKVLAQLNHPHVVGVYEASHVDGEVFVAMELVQGVTLSRWLALQPRTWKEIRDATVQAARGLVAAHDAGIVHRDVKPTNLLVDGNGVVKVVDFGLAGPAASRGSGEVVGTPAYMAPEQFDGQATPAADQWGLCATLFEALYRQRPFVGRDWEAMKAAVCDGELPQVPSRGIPGWLAKAVRRGLRVEPSERFASVAALIDALTRDRRSRRRAWAAAGIVGLLAGGGAYAAATLRSSATQGDVRQEVERLRSEALQAAADHRYVYPETPGGPSAYARVVSLEQLEGALARDVATDLRRRFADDLVQLGDRYWHDPNAAGFAVDYYIAARLFDPEHERARTRSSITPGQLAAFQKQAADCSFPAGDVDAARPLAALAETDPERRASRVRAVLSQPRALGHAARRGLSRIAGLTEPEPAPVEIQPSDPPTNEPDPPALEPTAEPPTQPEARAEPAGRKPNLGAAKAATRRGVAALAGDQLNEAETHFQQALSHKGNHAAALAGLSEVRFERGRHHGALQYAKRAVAAAPKNGRYRKLLGDALVKVVRYADAKAEYDRAVTLGYAPALKARARLDARLGQP
ncbi:MAG: protein kinase [Myxococcota bacterium]